MISKYLKTIARAIAIFNVVANFIVHLPRSDNERLIRTHAERGRKGERDKSGREEPNVLHRAPYHCPISTDSRKHATKRNFRRNRHPCGIRANKTARGTHRGRYVFATRILSGEVARRREIRHGRVKSAPPLFPSYWCNHAFMQTIGEYETIYRELWCENASLSLSPVFFFFFLTTFSNNSVFFAARRFPHSHIIANIGEDIKKQRNFPRYVNKKKKCIE